MRRRRAAFTLLEMVVATLIFSGVFSGIAAGWIFYEKAVQKYRQRNLARFVAQNEMESCLAEGFKALTPDYVDGINNSPDVVFVRTVDGASSPSTFQRSLTVSGSNDDNLKSVKVSISYDDRGERRVFELETVMFRSD